MTRTMYLLLIMTWIAAVVWLFLSAGCSSTTPC